MGIYHPREYCNFLLNAYSITSFMATTDGILRRQDTPFMATTNGILRRQDTPFMATTDGILRRQDTPFMATTDGILRRQDTRVYLEHGLPQNTQLVKIQKTTLTGKDLLPLKKIHKLVT
jgi:hypothetical protein